MVVTNQRRCCSCPHTCKEISLQQRGGGMLIFRDVMFCMPRGWTATSEIEDDEGLYCCFSNWDGDLAIFIMAAVRHLGLVNMTSQYCVAWHMFVVQILSWNFMLIGLCRPLSERASRLYVRSGACGDLCHDTPCWPWFVHWLSARWTTATRFSLVFPASCRIGCSPSWMPPPVWFTQRGGQNA